METAETRTGTPGGEGWPVPATAEETSLSAWRP